MAAATDWDEVPGFYSDDDVIIMQALDEGIEPCRRETNDATGDECFFKDIQRPVDWIVGYRTGLSVSDLINQFWCEQQFEYSFTHPLSYPIPKTVATGAEIHKERELEIHDIVEIHYETKEDIWATKLLNIYQQLLMLSNGCTVRELPIFGTLWNDNILINGVIDEIKVNSNGKMEIRELKTRAKKTLPNKAIQEKYELQVMIYQKLLCDLIIRKTGLNTIKDHVKVKWDLELNTEVKIYAEELSAPASTLNDVYKVLESFLEGAKFQEFGCSFIEYCFQSTKETIGFHEFYYSEMWLRDILEKQFDYLLGERNPIGVDIEEAWKCQNCDYQDICSWRKKQDSKCRERNALNTCVGLGQLS